MTLTDEMWPNKKPNQKMRRKQRKLFRMLNKLEKSGQ
jgi:hypothetical protein